MRNDSRLDNALAVLGSDYEGTYPSDFMDGVWVRAGHMEAISAGRHRLALLAGMSFVGLGAGFVTAQTPAYAEPTSHQVVYEAEFSPAALLRVAP